MSNTIEIVKNKNKVATILDVIKNNTTSVNEQSKRVNSFILFCKTMGLNNDQIEVVLNSKYEENKTTALFNSGKYRHENRKTTTLPDWIDIYKNTFEEYLDISFNSGKINKKEYDILKDFEKDLEKHNLTLEQFFALNLYTDEYGLDDFTNSANVNYQSFNYILRNGYDKFKDVELNKFLLHPIDSVFEITTCKMIDRTHKKYQISQKSKSAIKNCTKEILNSPSIKNIWTDNNFNDIIQKYKNEIDKEIFEDAKELIVDFGKRCQMAERITDVIKSTIGYHAKSIQKPTILHRITNIATLKNKLNLQSENSQIETDNLYDSILQDDNFTSTSTSFLQGRINYGNSTFNNCEGDVYIEILVPAGTKGVSINSISIYKEEKEVLLNPNQMYILDVDENYYVEKAKCTIPKITAVVISNDLSDYPTILKNNQIQTKQVYDTELEK